MNQDFYLLSLLVENDIKNLENLINFIKSSSIHCWTTDQLFMNKHGKNIELFSVSNLINNEELCLPKSAKFTISRRNFMQCIMNIKKLHDQTITKIYIAIDEQGSIYITHDLASIKKYDFLSSLLSSIKNFFIRK
jgi:hypothetical protein